jgi:hypothetical protein
MVAPVPAISIIGALSFLIDICRDKPDKPGDDVSAAATSFAPLTKYRKICLRYVEAT